MYFMSGYFSQSSLFSKFLTLSILFSKIYASIPILENQYKSLKSLLQICWIQVGGMISFQKGNDHNLK